MPFKDRSIQDFLDELASSSATPGGGTAAALAGAMGAALLGMVCELTVGKKELANAAKELHPVIEEAEMLRRGLADLADADSQAFNQVMAAYRLPKGTPEEQTSRREAIQDALRHAAQVPLDTATACARVVKLANQVICKINPNAVSDAGAAALLGEAGLRAAQVNVMINLSSIKDLEFVREKRRALEEVLAGTDKEKERVLKSVLEQM
jgi:formiminotetrahydrofolate cyclodeaminase